jgi:hypothetical protein
MHRMVPTAFAGAVVLAFAAMPAAHAGIDFSAGGASVASLSARPAEFTAPGSSTIEKAGDGASLGGAVFSPFAESAKSSAPHKASAERTSATDEPDLTLSLVVVLAAAAALVCLMRRVTKP